MNFLPKSFIIKLVLLINFINRSQAQEHSITRSIVGMTELLKAENLLIAALTNYIEDFEKKIKIMERILDDLKYEHEKAEIDPEEYLGNPLRSFALIRRLHSEWQQYELYLADEIPAFPEIFMKYNNIMPDDNDLKAATIAMQRLQSTYGLKVEDMAEGLLNGKWYNSNLTVHDTFTIGYELYKQHRYFEAIPWLNLSLNIPFDQDMYAKVLKFGEKEIHYIYIQALLQQDLFPEALDAIRTAIKLYPTEPVFDNMIEELYFYTIRPSKGKAIIKRSDNRLEYFNILCRDKQTNIGRNSKNLYCYYHTVEKTFTFLAPFKIEELSLEPFMALYYDVVSDYEIEELKSIAVPILKPAELSIDNKKFFDPRSAKTAWLTDDESETIAYLNQRITDMTGFNLKASERLQIVNYGLGGHYEMHYDALGKSTADRDKSKDRRATLLIYLSDVEQGGNTIFPNLDIVIKPRKGQALLWYNIDNNGNYNHDTLHAACPVLVGSKWVLTKWIHEYENFQLGFGPVSLAPRNKSLD